MTKSDLPQKVQIYEGKEFSLVRESETKYVALIPFDLDSPYCESYAVTAIRHAMLEAYEDLGVRLNELEDER